MDRWLNEPKYESDLENTELKFAYWEGHRDFAYDLVSFVRPKTIVELGSQYGCSLFSFCQSVKDNNLKTEITAIDFWQGDIGAVHTGQEVFDIVVNTANKHFSSIGLNLVRSGFNDYLNSISDNSIDILHIDGSHKYEDVKHDFISWMPKLSKNGIIMMHDVYSDIDKGANIFWQELIDKYPYFEFMHSCGLGVIFPKGKYFYESLLKENINYLILIYQFRAMAKYKQNRFYQLEKTTLDRYKEIENMSLMIKERDNTIQSMDKIVKEKDNTIQSMDKMVKERDNTIQSMAKIVKERDNTIQSMDMMIKERDNTIQSLKEVIKKQNIDYEKQKDELESILNIRMVKLILKMKRKKQ